MNRIILMGNLTRDPEVKYAKSGTAIAKFGMAVNSYYGGSGDDRKEETLFVDVTVFGRQAETVGEYLGKGRQALIEGRLTYQTWESQDGQKRSKHEVIADRVQFIGGQRGESQQSSATADTPAEDDDIPF